MEIPDEGELPPGATVIFVVSGNRIDPERGLDAAGLNCHDDGISVTCVDVFPGEGGEQLRNAALAIGHDLRIRKSAKIAKISVAEIHAAFEGEPTTLTVERDKILPHNPGHCLIKGIAEADEGNQMILAAAVCELLDAKDFAGVVNWK